MALLASLRNRFVLKIFLIGLFLRIASAITLHYFSSVYVGGTSLLSLADEYEYYKHGVDIAQSWKEGKNPRVPGNPGYYVVNGAIYFLIGSNILYVRIFNCVINALVIVYTYLIAQSIYDRKVAKIASMIVTLYPAIIVQAAFNHKDSLVTLLVVIAVYHGVKIAQRKERLYGYIWIALAIAGMNTMRPYMAYYTLITVIVYQFIVAKEIYIRRFLTASPLIILLIIFISYGYISPAGYIDTFVGAMTTERVHEGEASSYFAGRTFSGLSDTISFLPLGTIHFMSTPLPWKAANTFETFGAIMWHVLIPYLIYGIIHSIRFKWKESFILYIPVIILTVTIILVFAGGSQRHRMQVEPLLIILTALGVSQIRKGLFPVVVALTFYILYMSGLFYLLLGIRLI